MIRELERTQNTPKPTDKKTWQVVRVYKTGSTTKILAKLEKRKQAIAFIRDYANKSHDLRIRYV